MYKELKIDGYGFHINERGWGTIIDNYDGRAIELSISTMKKMIAAYEKEFPTKRGARTSINPIEDACTIDKITLRKVLLYEKETKNES